MKKSAINKRVILFFVATVIALCVGACVVFCLGSDTGAKSSENSAGGANSVSASAIGENQIDFSTVDRIPVFVNSNQPRFKAHGDITAVYKHNDGWYPAQKYDEIPVEIRTITNAYYYETGNEIPIRIATEVVNSTDSTKSTLVYDGVTINITDRAGLSFTAPDEYIATFKFNAPAGKTFYYGVGPDDEIKDSNKGLSITQRTDTSFVLVKHWFIVKYSSLFVANDDVNNFPYVPFHDKALLDYTNEHPVDKNDPTEGSQGETNTSIDTITYGEDFAVKVPEAREGAYKGKITFDVDYVDLDGRKYHVATNIALGTTNTASAKKLDYYFNKTMPAGKYTLKLYGDFTETPDFPEDKPTKIIGEYWLNVLPKQFDSETTSYIQNIQNAIRGALVDGEYVNAYTLGAGKKLHESLKAQTDELNATLNNTLGTMVNNSYWSDLSAADKAAYYDSAVEIMYNRNTWSSSNYVSESDMTDMLTQVGTYTIYYSVSAKNYVTIGGAGSANRTDYVFHTRLTTGISINDIYNLIVNGSNPYFKATTYTGNQTYTLVPNSVDYSYSFDDKDADGNENYINVRENATVTLTVQQPELKSWENDLDASVTFGDYFELSADSQTLKVKFDINPATNTWTVAPQMSPWAYGGFNAETNLITYALAFPSASVYYRIGTKSASNEYTWESVNGTLEMGDEFFAVDANGRIIDDEDGNVTAMFNSLGAGTYCLNGYIAAIENVNARQMRNDGSSNVFVVKAANSWVDTPVMTGWAYNGFTADSCFFTGRAMFGGDNVTYSLYDGRVASADKLRKTFKTLDDVVGGEKISDTLKGLNAGTYTLVASLAGTDDYSSLSQTMTLDVTPAVNAWKSAPVIGNWVYNEFTDSLFTAGEASHGQIGYTVQYVDETGNPAENVDDTKVGLNEGALRTMLGTLGAGRYNLLAKVDATGNYGATSQSIRFSVNKAYNAWENDVPPAIVGWVFGEYNATVNSPTAAQAVYTSGITYTYQYFPAIRLSGIWTANGEEIAQADLADAPAGDYIMIVTADGNVNYNALVYTVNFVISKQSNSWITEPTDRLDWSLSNTNIIAGSALVNAAATEQTNGITYKIENTVATGTAQTITVNSEDDRTDLVNALKALTVGSYRITVTVEESDNYGVLQKVTTSTVSSAQNTWKTELEDVSWTWGSFAAVSASLTKPEATYGKDTVVFTVKQVGNDDGIDEFTGGLDSAFNALKSCFKDLRAGAYTVTVYIPAGTDYTELESTVNVTVSVVDNSWESEPGDGTSNSIEITRKYGDDISDIAFKATYGNDKLAITVNGVTVTDISRYINNKIGEYLIVATVDANDEYSALVYTVRLIIEKAANDWTTDLEISDWIWNDVESNIDTGLVFPVAEQGASALVTVTVKATGSVAFEATVNYSADRTVNANDIAALERRLKALDVVNGGYTITVNIAETDSYASLTGEKAQTADFVIEQAENSWATNGEPKISAWDFGGTTAYPTATPVFGKNTVVFAYADTSDADEFNNGERYKPATNAVWNSAPNYGAGSYWLRATVPSTDNYTALVDYCLFTINEGKNDWVNRPGVVEWSWNGYDASTNLFSGSARSNKPAQFSITFDDGSTNQDGSKKGRELTVGDFIAIDGTTISTATIAKLKSFTLTANDLNLNVVSDEVAKLLNALKNGKYVLTVSIAGGQSLDSITDSTTFTVHKANNRWTTDEEGKTLAPSVRDYAYGASSVVTSGTPLYGTIVSYRIALGDSYVSDVITDLTVLQNKLKTLSVATYFLHAWVVAGSTDTFNGLYSESDPYKTSFVVSPATNYWDVSPKTSVSEYYAVIHGGSFDTQAWLGKPVAANGTAVYTIMNIDFTQRNATPYSYADYVSAVNALNPGEYIVRVSVAEATNYLALAQDMSLTINRYKSRFGNLPEKLTGKWQQDDNKKTATVLDDANIKAYSYKTVGETNTDVAELDVKYVLSGVTYGSFAELKTAVKALGKGSFQVTVVVEQTGDYEGLSAILQLDIAAGDNLWIAGENAPAPEDSIIVKDDPNKAPVAVWAWSTEVDWLGVKPLYGDTVVIRIVAQADASNVLKFFTVNTGEGFDTQRELVSAYISKLDVGAYVMIVTTPAGDNWNGIDDVTAALQSENVAITTRIGFEIVEAENDWKSQSLAPSFGGNNIVYENGVYKWAFGTAVTPIAEARHGNVSIVYYNAEGTRLSGMPTAAGTYRAVFSVPKPASGNYSAIDGARAVTLMFTVEGVVYEAFDVSLGVSGWVWNSYDRTVNQIKGKPVSGGNVHFAILDDKGKVLIDKFELVDGNGKYNANFDKDVYVPTAVAAKLNALIKGTYTLRVYVDARANYEAFTADATFNVTEAVNTWEVTPKIASWFRGGWLESKNTPEAVSRYGAPIVVITSNASGETLYRAVYNEQTGKYDVSLNLLESADAGWYTMSVGVDGCDGMYTALPTSEVQFQIFIQGSPDDKNFWEVTPGIEGWTATIDGKVVMPTGKPVRGKPYFVFYKAELDGDEYKLTEMVGAGVDSVTVKKGETYAQDFYIPMAPGTYFMYAYAKNAAVPSDTLDEDDSGRVMLIIRNRTNSWEKSVSISSRLYLGERDSWVNPVAKASLSGSDIEYKFFDSATRAELGTEIPTVAGKYVVVAYASNRYSLTIESEMEFEVMLSKNYWVGDTSPTIENWSEEFSATSPDPVGAAVVGTIVYTYIDKADPGTEHTEKPTAAGNYIMIARVEYDGYETLEAHYEFTIEPAFDSTLALIDIVLGVVAVILAIFVIIFAIRRYKENG